MTRVSAIEYLRVMAKERRIERIQRKRKKIRIQINNLHMRLVELEDLDHALQGREGELCHQVEFSGVYDD